MTPKIPHRYSNHLVTLQVHKNQSNISNFVACILSHHSCSFSSLFFVCFHFQSSDEIFCVSSALAVNRISSPLIIIHI